MLYNEYRRVSITQSAIWIDDNAYQEDCDQVKLFENLYNLFYKLAIKNRYFNNLTDVDDFSIYAASQLFNRYLNKELSEIKSSLNYARKVIGPYRAQFQNQFYRENITREKLKDYDTRYDTNLELQLLNKSSGISQCDFLIYLDDIAKTLKGSIKNIPKKKNSNEFENIYISCLLTFIDLITLSKYDQDKLNNINKSDKVKDNLYKSLYRIPNDYQPILYHLDESYSNYILILVNKAKIAIKNDLKEIMYSQVSVKDLYSDMLNDLKDDDD